MFLLNIIFCIITVSIQLFRYSKGALYFSPYRSLTLVESNIAYFTLVLVSFILTWIIYKYRYTTFDTDSNSEDDQKLVVKKILLTQFVLLGIPDLFSFIVKISLGFFI